MKNKIKQQIGIGSSLILALIFGLPPQPAKATASGCSDFDFYSSSTCIKVVGSGLNINSVQGNFSSPFDSLCYWRYIIRFKDRSNKVYASLIGPTHISCDKSGSYLKTYPPKKPYRAKEGRVCAELYRDVTTTNEYVDAACVNITL